MFFFPNTLILEQFDKVITGAKLFNAHLDCLAKHKPDEKSMLSKLPKDILLEITHYLPFKDLEPIFFDISLQAIFKVVIEDYQKATEVLLRSSLRHHLRFINPCILQLDENARNALIFLVSHSFPAQLFETINPARLSKNFKFIDNEWDNNLTEEELSTVLGIEGIEGISKGVRTGHIQNNYKDSIYISIFNENGRETYFSSGHSWENIGQRILPSARSSEWGPLLTHEEMAKKIHQAI